ncbi:SRPBCC family protein [Nonomuraea sp. NPDC050540]|uniref:SRPBCC family protein n=1 Tax=Nonomuraea sp. NPDC050540 TaxID=3364367 RepID=UPI0037AFCD4B
MSAAQYTLTGRLAVALPPGEAFTLFTPRGEERWAAGWRPRFPAKTSDDSAPGTVFETGADDDRTIWVVVEREPARRVSYARVTPGSRAGTVTVEVDADGQGGSTVRVTYGLTALTAEGQAPLREFAERYPDFLRSWEVEIARHLGPRRRPRTPGRHQPHHESEDLGTALR